jgi:transcriptional regulator with XRE-family HTH domain
MAAAGTKRGSRIEQGKTDYGRVKYPDFAARVQRAMDMNLEVPPPNYGRLGWIVRRFDDKFAVRVTSETVRKWIEGISSPRPEARAHLAEILGVDEAWLLLGDTVTLDRKEKRLRNAEVDGAVNLVAGLIQMDGGTPAFPTDGPNNAARPGVDLYAVIRGAHYALSVTVAESITDTEWSAPVPGTREDMMVLVLVRTGTFSFDVLALDEAALAEHTTFIRGQVTISIRSTKKGYVVGAGTVVKKLQSFAERF